MQLSLIIPKPHRAAASALQFNRRFQVGTALVLMLSALAGERTEAAGTLYWSSDRITRASTEGDCRQEIRRPEINANILDVDVDQEAGKLYFIYHASIRRCDLDGGNTEVVYSPPPGTGASVLDIDRVNRKLYWIDNSGPPIDIMRSNLDGSNVERVISGDFPGCYGIAVDPAGGKVYWAERDDGAIHRVNFDGTANEQIAVSGQVPFGITVHHASGKVFWTDFGFGATPGGVYRANLDLSGVEQIVSGLSSFTGIDIDEAAGMLYFCRQQPDGVFRCDLNGGGLVTLGTGSAYGIACVSEELGFECFGDTNSDLHVNIDDILNVISSWGPCRSCEVDFNGDGIVNIADLLYVISHWTT